MATYHIFSNIVETNASYNSLPSLPFFQYKLRYIHAMHFHLNALLKKITLILLMSLFIPEATKSKFMKILVAISVKAMRLVS